MTDDHILCLVCEVSKEKFRSFQYGKVDRVILVHLFFLAVACCSFKCALLRLFIDYVN